MIYLFLRKLVTVSVLWEMLRCLHPLRFGFDIHYSWFMDLIINGKRSIFRLFFRERLRRNSVASSDDCTKHISIVYAVIASISHMIRQHFSESNKTRFRLPFLTQPVDTYLTQHFIHLFSGASLYPPDGTGRNALYIRCTFLMQHL